MNGNDFYRKLILAARRSPPSDHVPYAFEKRVMAVLKTRPQPDHWTLWANSLWRAAGPCVGVMLLLGAWNAVSLQNSNDANEVDLESAILSGVNSIDEAW
jgi:hypothetical protein